MRRSDLAREVLDQQEFAEYLATERLKPAEGTTRSGLPRINSDGYDQHGESHGTPGHWDWQGGHE